MDGYALRGAGQLTHLRWQGATAPLRCRSAVASSLPTSA